MQISFSLEIKFIGSYLRYNTSNNFAPYKNSWLANIFDYRQQLFLIAKPVFSFLIY